MSESECVSQFMNRLLFQTVYQGGAPDGILIVRIASESMAGDHCTHSFKLSLSKNVGKYWVEKIDVGNPQNLQSIGWSLIE